jgi:uncharacterized protein
MSLQLRLLNGTYSWTSTPPGTEIPTTLRQAEFWMVSGDSSETTIVGPAEIVEGFGNVSSGWRIFEISGELSHDLTGITASVAVPLAQAGVQIMPVATYRTDYIGVNGERLEQAMSALTGAGFTVIADPS